MWVIYIKEIRSFFSSLTGYIVLGVFLVLLGLMCWVFPDYSILEYGYATMDSFFELSPVVFLFLIPAICMRSFSEEWHTGTFELLLTRPLTNWSIVIGKFLSAWSLAILSLLPTLIYWFTVYQLGSPKGNIDMGGTIGAYIGLAMLSGVFVATGVFSSALTNNQVVSFLLAVLLCFIVYWGFGFFSKLPVFIGNSDDFIQQLGVEYHYNSISRGVVDSRDMVYFGSMIAFFLVATEMTIRNRKG